MKEQVIVAQELKEAGFQVEVTVNGILVSLNRSISTQEVFWVLDKSFDGIEFGLSSVNGKVLVTVL